MGQLRNVNTLRSTLHSDYVEKQESAVYYDARSKDFPQRRRGGGGNARPQWANSRLERLKGHFTRID